ncbi:hypothetical protein HC928_09930 [bacterium]|nr:hypothetical protein [bacterium]
MMVDQDPKYHLKPGYRMEVYRTFGWPLVRGYNEQRRAYCRSGHLARITAQQVYPIWERQIPHLLAQDPTADVYTPYRLLIASEAFVNTLDPRVKSQLETLTHRTHDWLGAMAYDIPLQAFSAAHAILNAANTILRPHLLELISQETFVAHLTDDDLDVLALDYAGAAMKAYTTLDPEKPAMEPSEPVAMAYFQQQQAFWTAMEMVSFQRRREFWTWWLSTAVPAAWEAAQS